MPRTPRVQYENAIYHVMARGDRREPIVYGDDDRQLFLDTFAEACGRTGWEVFAWVLLDNHYHAVFRTPEPNLVDGMQWFQNTFTRRINARHRLWGHLFGGRYKAIPIEDEATNATGSIVWRDYLRSAVDYVHLNPSRAGLVDGSEASVRDYPWSSLATGYSLSSSKRPSWMAIPEGLDLFGEPDTVAERRRFVERLDRFSRDEAGDPPDGDGIPLSKRFERGWFWGSEAFREILGHKIEKMGARKSRNYQSRSIGPASDHGRRRAEQIVEEGAKHYGMTVEQLREDRRGDWRRTSVAWAVAMETSVPQQWIADHLDLKSPANASQQVRRFRQEKDRDLPVAVREWKASRNRD